MERKALSGLTIKDADKGEISAVFATFDVVDHDGDVVEKAAFTPGSSVVISAYNHASWEPGALPVGRGTVRVTDSEAILDGKFFDTAAARDTFATIKELGDLQEYSWGFDITKHAFEQRDGKTIRLLQGVDLFEVSPVLRGASINTRTLAAKSAPERGADRPSAPHKTAVPPHETATTDRSWDGAAAVKGIAADVKPSELRSVFAWRDPAGDVEAKGDYRFPHHQGVGGPANVRACLAAIAALNGARGGAPIPDDDRKAVYDHLAAHLRDAERDVPELRSGDGERKFSDELLETMAVVSATLDSAARVAALRAEKGKTLSRVTAEILDWIGDDLKRLDALLTTPPAGAVSEEELTSTVLAGLARLRDI